LRSKGRERPHPGTRRAARPARFFSRGGHDRRGPSSRRGGVAPMKRLTILGSTGSIGCSTLDLVGRAPESFAVEALVAGRNAAKLAEQARRFRAKVAVIADDAQYRSLKAALAGTGIEVAAGSAAVIEAAERPSEWVMAAVVGAAGLAPTLSAIRRGAV